MKRYEEQFKRLTEVGSVNRGKSKHRPRNAPELFGGRYPFVQTGDVKAASLFITEFSQTYNERGLAQSKLWQPGTLLITIAANIADTAILGLPACFPDSIVGFLPKKGSADVRFIKYCLDTYKTQMQSISQGTTQDNLSQAKLHSLRFRIPDYSQQRKIAAILSAYDELIENNRRRIALLEKLAEEIYREWFVRMRFPGHEKRRVVRGVPAGWTEASSDTVYRVMSGGTPNTDNRLYWDGDIPFFTPKDSGENVYVLKTERTITQKGLESCNSRLYEKDTIFITARGTVGKICMAHRAMAMNQTCYALAPRSGGEVFFHFLSIRNAVAYIKGVSKSGVFDNIVVDTFKSIPILLPATPLIALFNSIAEPLFGQIGLLLEENELLTKTRDLLLPRLISGKLSVEHLDIQFPPGMAAEETGSA